MSEILIYSLFINGIVLVMCGLVMKTKNFTSSFIFKFFPFSAGVINIIVSSKLLNWI